MTPMEFFWDVAVNAATIYVAIKVGRFWGLTTARRLLGDVGLGMAKIKHTEEEYPNEATRMAAQSHSDIASKTAFASMVMIEELAKNYHPILFRLMEGKK